MFELYSSVIDIRRKVFAELARLAFEGGDMHQLAALPYKIIPGDQIDVGVCGSRAAGKSALAAADLKRERLLFGESRTGISHQQLGMLDQQGRAGGNSLGTVLFSSHSHGNYLRCTALLRR